MPLPFLTVSGNSLEAFIYPQFCKKCDNEMYSLEILYCRKCLKELNCSEMGNWVNDLTTNTGLDAAFSLFWFDDLLQDVIHQVKYNGYKRFANYLINTFSKEIRELLGESKIDVLVPVPLHKVKKRERGFNQAEVIANSIGSIINISVDAKVLQRTRWTQTQTKLEVMDRKKNTRDAFSITKNVMGKRFLLVDDVLTTGATASACAMTMKSAGSDLVGVFTLGTPKLEK